MTWEWIAFTAVICTFIVFVLWVAAWSEHKIREASRERTIFGSRPAVPFRRRQETQEQVNVPSRWDIDDDE